METNKINTYFTEDKTYLPINEKDITTDWIDEFTESSITETTDGIHKTYFNLEGYSKVLVFSYRYGKNVFSICNADGSALDYNGRTTIAHAIKAYFEDYACDYNLDILCYKYRVDLGFYV